MFRRLVALLTLAATLVHSALGCCAHHDHCGDEHGQCQHQVVSADVAFPDAGCFGRESTSSSADVDQSEPASPCDHRHGPCDEPNCVFLTAKTIQLSHDLGLLVAILPAPPLTVVTEISLAHPRVVECGPPPLPAQRSRALLQSWTV